MKKIFTTFLSLLLVFSLTACADSNNSQENSSSEPQLSEVSPSSTVPESSTEAPAATFSGQDNTQGQNDSGGKKILIAYFTRVGNTDFDENVDAISSASLQKVDSTLKGNTQLIADTIQSAVGGDLFLITTVNKYPADYDETIDLGQQENNDNARPALAAHVENMDDYDTVFLGFPNWWYDMPMAVYSFLEEYDFSGKTVVPFSTSGGSGFSDSIETISGMYPEATVLDGFTVRDSGAVEAQEDVLQWLRDLGFIQ